jgi:cation:H+ antiporter
MLAVGLALLVLGAHWLVESAIVIARYWGLSELVIGLTVVAFGTSSPELLVCLMAAFQGTDDISVGNIVGSNIANILLIIGVSALVWPIKVMGATLRRDTAMMMAAVLVLVPIFAVGQVGRLSGVLLVAGLAGYLVWAYVRPGVAVIEEEGVPAPSSVLVSSLWVVGGLVALMLGARFLVDGAVAIARGYGISEAFIGLTIVAVGTSLPELATSLIAALRRQSEIAIGNILGSGIFNVLGILGLTAVITPIPVAPRFLTFDLPVLIAVSLLLAMLLLTRPVIGRGVGVAMLAGYVAYIWAAQG